MYLIVWPIYIALLSYISSNDKAFKSLVTGFVFGIVFVYLSKGILTTEEFLIIATVIGLYCQDVITIARIIPNLYLKELQEA